MNIGCESSATTQTQPRLPVGAAELEVDGQTCESWGAVVAKFTDASMYQTWAYGAVRWGAPSLSHMVWRRDGYILGAAQVRVARVPLIRAGVAYLRWGPLCERKREPFDPAVLGGMIADLRHEYVSRRGLALQIIPNAPASGDRAAALGAAFHHAGLLPEWSVSGYRTMVVDLRPNLEVLRARLDQKWRNQLKRSEANGLILEVSDGPDTFREFLRLYAAMRKRKRFETGVDAGQFERMQTLLFGPAKMQVFLAKKDGEAIGALVFSLLGDTSIYLFGATNQRARELKASYFLHWQAMRWLKERGARSYDLGGIDPEANPGGYHFKRGFGGGDVTHLPPHGASVGLRSRAVMAGVVWLAHQRNPCPAPVAA